MISTTTLKKRIRNKTDPVLVSTIRAARKHPEWIKVANQLSSSHRTNKARNLRDIEQIAKDGQTIVVTGTVLGVGTLNKKITLCALHYSASAQEKLKTHKTLTILEEINKNPSATGVIIL